MEHKTASLAAWRRCKSSRCKRASLRFAPSQTTKSISFLKFHTASNTAPALAHCAWARPEELALLAERGVTIAVNASSNLGLKSGLAPVPEMLRQGCRVAMGLDGMAFNEDDDALHEMRLGYALHRGWGFARR